MLAPLSNDEIAAAKTHWEAKNDESLVDKLNSEIRGGLRELIVGLLTGKRTESEEADEVYATRCKNMITSAFGSKETFLRESGDACLDELVASSGTSKQPEGRRGEEQL